MAKWCDKGKICLNNTIKKEMREAFLKNFVFLPHIQRGHATKLKAEARSESRVHSFKMVAMSSFSLLNKEKDFLKWPCAFLSFTIPKKIYTFICFITLILLTNSRKTKILHKNVFNSGLNLYCISYKKYNIIQTIFCGTLEMGHII